MSHLWNFSWTSNPEFMKCVKILWDLPISGIHYQCHTPISINVNKSTYICNLLEPGLTMQLRTLLHPLLQLTMQPILRFRPHCSFCICWFRCLTSIVISTHAGYCSLISIVVNKENLISKLRRILIPMYSLPKFKCLDSYSALEIITSIKFKEIFFKKRSKFGNKDNYFKISRLLWKWIAFSSGNYFSNTNQLVITNLQINKKNFLLSVIHITVSWRHV